MKDSSTLWRVLGCVETGGSKENRGCKPDERERGRRLREELVASRREEERRETNISLSKVTPQASAVSSIFGMSRTKIDLQSVEYSRLNLSEREMSKREEEVSTRRGRARKGRKIVLTKAVIYENDLRFPRVRWMRSNEDVSGMRIAVHLRQ